MTYATRGQTGLNYFPCRYGASKLLFRGPRRQLQGDYVAFLGGIETYGKFIEAPFPMLLEYETGVKSVNLGCVNAGIDAYATDKSLLNICVRAKVTVIQIMGAQNMSNRCYSVHPRRNDRFLHASSLLKTVYKDIDFTEFNFTRHLISALAEASPAKFEMVQQELKEAWVSRMNGLIAQIDGPVVLLWLADHAPDPGADAMHSEPLFVDRPMLDRIAAPHLRLAEIIARPDEIAAGLPEMVYSEMERPLATGMLGPVVHRRVADTLAKLLPHRP